jgi:hypothetical protein
MRIRSPSRSILPLQLLLGAILLVCASLEAWFGRPELFGDDISYLDISHLIRQGNWHDAINPLWSIGYPLLLAILRPLFPAGVHGELIAVFALNLLAFLFSWLTFLYFLRTALAFLSNEKRAVILSEARRAESKDLHESESAAESQSSSNLNPALLVSAFCIFLSVQPGLGKPSSIGPDQLVTALFFLASALLLRFALDPTPRRGLALGVVLGLGFLVKAIFMPLSVIFIAAAMLPLRRTLRPAAAFAIPTGLVLFMLPYAIALSWAVGRPTLGEAAQLNYAFHVNQLPHWMGWQGGPPRLGYPLHPVHLLRDHPAVFAFGEPFHTTYPPQFNIPYWYDGYRHFFSPVNALRSIAVNLHALESVLHENWPITLAIVFAITILWVPHLRQSHRLRWGLLRAWPIYLPSLLALVLYLQVHLEARYIAAFLAVLAIFPLLISRPLRLVVPAILLAGTALNLGLHLRLTRPEFTPQWTIARYLTASGLHPGDRVASVTTLNDIRCTWAYAAGLHIVADIGNDAYDPQSQQQDFDLFWRDPAIQSDVLRLFREQGAIAVIAPSVPPSNPPIAGNWQPIPNTNAWVLKL